MRLEVIVMNLWRQIAASQPFPNHAARVLPLLFVIALNLSAQSSPPLPADCDFSCPYARAGTMNKIKWAGPVTTSQGANVFLYNPAPPAFAFQTGFFDTRVSHIPGDQQYRFSTGHVGYACYNYSNVFFQSSFEIHDQKLPGPSQAIFDVYVNNDTDRVVQKVDINVLPFDPTKPFFEMLYGHPVKNVVLPQNISTFDPAILDPANWDLPSDFYSLNFNVFGDAVQGIPASVNAISSSACPIVATPVMMSTDPNPTHSNVIHVTVFFGEPVTGFSAAGIVPGNATVTNFAPADGPGEGFGATYGFDLIATGPGVVTADIPAGAAVDANNNATGAATQFQRVYDNTFVPPPNVAIDQAATQPDPTGVSPVHFTARFTEPVTGFTGACVALLGTAGATTAVVSEIAPNNGTTYDVAVSGMTTSGLVIASVRAGCAKDAAGNANYPSSSNDDVVTLDLSGNPDLTIGETHSPNFFFQGMNGATFSITVRNAGAWPTNGSTVTVTDKLPAGLTATEISGAGWSCTLSALTCTRSDVLNAATSYPVITLLANVSPAAPQFVTNEADVSGGGDTISYNDAVRESVRITAGPDLNITLTHSGNFRQGDPADTYSITITNAGGTATSGAITVNGTLPNGLSPTTLTGPAGWNCSLSPLACSSASLVAAGGNAAFTLTVRVAVNAPSSVTTLATVSGGSDVNTANNSAADPTTIIQTADMTISKTHSGSFTQSMTGAIYTITATNTGSGPTDGSAVTVTDSLPAGLTATAMAGTGWACTLAAFTCNRSDLLSAGMSYPPITVTVNVAPNAAVSVINTATVSGGGELNTANNMASDPTSINFAFQGFFAPIANEPSVNVVKAGSTVAVNFSLGGNQGLNIFAPGFPLAQQVSCATGSQVNVTGVAGTAGTNGLTYDSSAGVYTYLWRTDKSWPGTCRQFILRLTDGSTHKADFQFR